jgi:hypothetical protein
MPRRPRRGTALIEEEMMVVGSPAVLEVECALRANDRLGRPAILSALRKFAVLFAVAVEDPAILAHALDWGRQGMDFADASNLAGSPECEAFASFDRRLARAAAKAGALPVRTP